MANQFDTENSYVIQQNTGFGGQNPATAKIHIAPSNGTSNSSPIKLSPGGLVPNPEDGAIEYDGRNLFHTIKTSRNIINTFSNSDFIGTYQTNFTLNGKPFKFVGGNYYHLLTSTLSQVQQLLTSAKNKGISVLRIWCFDPFINFRSLVYPILTNLLSNNLTTNSFTGYDNGSGSSVNGSVFTFVSSPVPQTGAYCVKQNSAYNTYDIISTLVNVQPNTNYVWSFYYQGTNTPGSGSQLPPSVFITVPSAGQAPENNPIKWGGYVPNASSWSLFQTGFNSGNNTQIRLTIKNFGGQNLFYYNSWNLCLQQTPSLVYNESNLEILDTVLNQANLFGIRLILSLADGNESGYNTKGWYVQQANALYGTNYANSYPYLDFFTSSLIQGLYQNFFYTLATRKNTVNGLTYMNDPTIASWEMGNELRTNNSNDPQINTLQSVNLAILSNPGGWADRNSTYFKSIDKNHLVNFGDMAHGWAYTNNDIIWNGTYYGVDYNIMSKLPNIDFADFHLYPNQGQTELQAYGAYLGYPGTNGVSKAGFNAQVADFVNVPHTNGKPSMLGEVGFVQSVHGSTTYIPLYNRFAAFNYVFNQFLTIDGGNGALIWSLTSGGPVGSSYDVALDATNGLNFTDNSNDQTIDNLILQYNDQYNLPGNAFPVNFNFINKYARPATMTIGAYNANDLVDYDVTCTGTADDGLINEVASYLAPVQGRTIFSEGTFNISSIITGYSKQVFEGQGAGEINNPITLFNLTTNANCGVFQSYQQGSAATYGITIKNLQIKGNASNQSGAGPFHAISMTSQEGEVSGVIIDSPKGRGIYFSGFGTTTIPYGRVINCKINNAGGSGYFFDYYTENMFAWGNKIQGCGNTFNEAGIVSNAVYTQILDHPQVYGNYQGIAINTKGSGLGTTVSRCVFEFNNREGAIVTDSLDTSFLGCRFLWNGQAANNTYSHLSLQGVDNVLSGTIVDHCTFRNSDPNQTFTNAAQYCVLFNNTQLNQVSNNSMHGGYVTAAMFGYNTGANPDVITPNIT